MKKMIVAAMAALGLVVAPVAAANAYEVTVNGHLWDITNSYFGVNELDDDDVFDYSYLSLSIDGGSNFEEYVCRTEDVMSDTTVASGKVISCDELVTTVQGLNVRGFAYVYPDGLLTAVTYKITNTTGASMPFKWYHEHNYGNPQINDPAFDDVYSIGDGSSNPSAPAAIAWGPDTQACSAASGSVVGGDGMEVTSESCTLAAGASTAITIYHMADDTENLADLQDNATAFFSTRSYDSTLAAGIPAGLVASNWGITGTLDISGVPTASAPWDETETMTLTGDATLGNYMTVAFKNGADPVGDYYDVWMCPNQDVKPIDGVIEGDCVAVTFWNRAEVANYDQSATALTMTWQLANEPVPGKISEGGANYLDSNGDPIMMDEPQDDGGWCAYEGWYIIVNDYQGGAHSNWSPALAAAGCSDQGGSDGSLAATGVDAQPAGLLGLFALIGGLAVTVIARRRNARAL